MFEKEAEEYVKQNCCETCIMADDCESGCIDCYTVHAYIAGAEPREKRIEELEKENAELKTEKAKWINATDKWKQRYITETQHFTKAKDHIKTLLVCLQQDTNDPQTNYYVVQYMTKAEQFLKDSEVEK